MHAYQRVLVLAVLLATVLMLDTIYNFVCWYLSPCLEEFSGTGADPEHIYKYLADGRQQRAHDRQQTGDIKQ
jgi:hypothetical protein